DCHPAPPRSPPPRGWTTPAPSTSWSTRPSISERTIVRFRPAVPTTFVLLALILPLLPVVPAAPELRAAEPAGGTGATARAGAGGRRRPGHESLPAALQVGGRRVPAGLSVADAEGIAARPAPSEDPHDRRHPRRREAGGNPHQRVRPAAARRAGGGAAHPRL